MATKRLRWAVNVKKWKQSSAEWCIAMACVQAEERDRINQFVFSNDATLSLVGRLMIRAAIVQLVGVGSDFIELGRSERGRPCVLNPPAASSYDINVSHQGCYAVLAAESRRKVGVDVMQLTRPRGIGTLQQFFSTMDRQFTANEWKQIQAPPTDKEKLAVFYRHWCLKESYIKAVGIGLSHGLQRIEFTLGNTVWGKGVCCDTSVCIDGRKPSIDWSFEESFVDNEHCVSVAVEQSPGDEANVPFPFEEVTIPGLLSKLTCLRETDESDWSLQLKRPTKPYD